MSRLRQLTRDLHRDETGPNTVEWILLIIIALILLIAIFKFGSWIAEEFAGKRDEMQQAEGDFSGAAGK